MKSSSLFVILAVVAARMASGASRLNTYSEPSFPFPHVYTAVVPASGSNAEQQGATYFAAEVDFLEVVEISEGAVKISFLVQDQEELEYLQGLTNLPSTNVHQLQMDSRLTSDLQYQLNYSDEKSRLRRQGSYSNIPGFSCYKNLQGTFDWMDDMVIRANSIPGLSVSLTDIGDSYLKTRDSKQGYDIWALKITGEATEAATEKGVFFAMAGIHAREYAPPELASRWAETLIDAYGNNADITAMLDHTEIHLVLQSNPDGRQVAETNRSVFKRKNLNPSGSGSRCGKRVGVDLNRNFPFRWGFTPGSSNDKCSLIYRGLAPASESEVQAIVQYCESIFPGGQRKANPEEQRQEAYAETTTMGIFIDIHSFGEIIIWPWSYQNLETGNDSGFEALANKYRHFNNYDLAGPETPNFLYEASGATDDWAYGALGAAGMTFEVGKQFYQDCEYFENSVLDVNIKALTYAAKTSKAPYSISKGPDVTSLATSVGGNTLTVTAAASDSAWSSSNQPTSNQGVSEIRVFINYHPYDGELDPQTGTLPHTGTLLTGASLTVDVSSFADGRHMVYVQATDGDGYKGPVTAAYFTKKDSHRSSPSNRPSGSPSGSPSEALSAFPSSVPSVAPSSAPSSLPSVAPSSAPSSAPSTEPSSAPSAGPSSSPSSAPSSSPSDLPSGSSSSSGDGLDPLTDDGTCFSGDMTVQVQNEGEKKMKDLKLGDMVKTSADHDRFEPVYSFGHRDATSLGDFLQFKTATTTLEMSKDHMVFVSGRSIPARMVKVGDKFDDDAVVEMIFNVVRKGVFAPFTPSGTILVNGVKASTYISFQSSPVVKIGSFETPLTYQWVAHAFEFPHRFYCNYFCQCLNEEYNEHGISVWVAEPLKMGRWLLNQSSIMIAVLLTPAVGVLVLFSALEILIGSPMLYAGLVAIWYLWARASGKKLKQV